MGAILLLFACILFVHNITDSMSPPPKKEKKKDNYCKQCGSMVHADEDMGFYFTVTAFQKYNPNAKTLRENLKMAA